MPTQQEYYTDPDLHGSYQYIKLSEVIDDILLEAQDDDSLLKNTKRSKFIKNAFRGVRELARSVSNDIRAMEISVPDTLVLPLPHNYVNWVRVSVAVGGAEKGFYLKPLDINMKMNTATSYLQDHDYKILFDDNGCALTANGANAMNVPYRSHIFEGGCGCSTPIAGNTKEMTKYGEFTIDERKGVIVFSSTLAGQIVVIEYVSDGLDKDCSEESITIHKYIREALYDFIVYESLVTKRNIPYSDKTALRNKWLSSRHRAAMARSDFDMLRIAKNVR